MRQNGIKIFYGFIAVLPFLICNESHAYRCLKRVYDNTQGRPRNEVFECPDGVPLSFGIRSAEEGKKYLEAAIKKVAGQLPEGIVPKTPARASVRVFMDQDGNVKKVMNSDSSGNPALDKALINAVYQVGPFGTVPKKLFKKVKATGVIMSFDFNNYTSAKREVK